MKKIILESYLQSVSRSEPMHSDTRECVRQYDEPCTSSEALRKSNRDVHTEVNPHRCRHCGKTLRKWDLRKHERTHAGETPYQCEFCDKLFAQKSYLYKHKMAVHNDDKPYECEFCNSSFNRVDNLRRHMIRIHNEILLLKCNKCPSTFDNHLSYIKHRQVHEGKKSHVCEFCGKVFASKKCLKGHRFVHGDKKLFQCSVCDKDYKHKRSLLGHIRKSHK